VKQNARKPDSSCDRILALNRVSQMDKMIIFVMSQIDELGGVRTKGRCLAALLIDGGFPDPLSKLECGQLREFVLQRLEFERGRKGKSRDRIAVISR